MEVKLRYCSIEWTATGARVVFPVGAEVSAWPHGEEPHYHVISHRSGYGDDLRAYCREHELAHVLVAEYFEDAPSHVLLRMARGMQIQHGTAVMEEVAAQMLQRWVRANERPIVAGCDWDQLKARFLECVAHLDGEGC